MWHNRHQFIVLMQAFVLFSLWCWQIFIQTKHKDFDQTKGVHISTHFVFAVLAGLLFFLQYWAFHEKVCYFVIFIPIKWQKVKNKFNSFKRTIVCKLSGNYKNRGDCGLTQFMNKNRDKQKEQLETVWTEGWSLKLGRQATTADYTFTCHHRQEDIRLKVL